MAGEAQQPVTEEMLKELQGEKEEKKETKSSFSSNRHWIIKMIKNISYISFFPYIWLWELCKKIARNKKKPITEVIIKKVSNNSEQQVSLQEVEETPVPTLDANIVNNSTEHESLPITTTQSNLTI